MKLDRYACDECTLTYWVAGDSGNLTLMCPRCGRENILVRQDTFDAPYGVPMLVAEVVPGRGAKRSTVSRPKPSPVRRKPVQRSQKPVTMALRLGGEA
jgi:hypothetical protein